MIPLAARNSSYVFGVAHTVSGSTASDEEEEGVLTIGSVAFPFFLGGDTIGSRFDGDLDFPCLVFLDATVGSGGGLA